ncbi:NUDIX domain-containing protein [Candidatus Woesearchaeota archaeon]|nr:NUDIX domain-containing protein [Candidatus Woesearchaeota archaeon]
MEYNYHVDENDKVIGKISRKEMREKNLLHRGSTTLIFNKKREILIHKRPKDKEVYPDCFSMIFGGGVKYGETYEEAAKRELKEEIGIECDDLRFEFYDLWEDEIDRCFMKIYSCVTDGPFNFDEKEVEEPRFISLEKLKKMIEEEFAPGDVYLFRKFLSKTSTTD